MTPSGFFPTRDGRDVLEYVERQFPFPLAVTYVRLQAEMDRDEPVAAAWQLRDAFECLLKFTTCLAVADVLQSQPESDRAQRLVELLFKPTGLSMGDWHTLLETALRPSRPSAQGHPPGSDSRLMPDLGGVFFKSNGKRTTLNRRIDGDQRSFVNWRNRVFGHGVFRQQRQWYAEQTLEWLPTLHEFYAALRPHLSVWRLVGLTPGGERVDWQGADEPPPTSPHEHQPWGEPLPMRLVRDDSPGSRELVFGALLSVQQCQICRQPAAFFFDRHKYQRDNDRHRTYFLEYFRGHHGEHRDWEETRQLANLLPGTFVWERTSYDVEAVSAERQLVFRGFDDEYQRPDYLLDAIWAAVGELDRGYVHVVGPEGVGKTYLVRGLENEGPDGGTPVLAHYIRARATADYRAFISELADRAHEQLRFRTQEIQTKVAAITDLQSQFTQFVTELMRANRLDQLVVAIDGLDELTDLGPDSATITDLLPPAAELPNGCYVVLSGRPELRPRVQERLEQLKGDDDAEFRRLFLDPGGDANQDVLRRYLAVRLPEALRGPGQVADVLARTGGVFLYAFHFCRALESGAFPHAEALPPGDKFYAAYLDRLRRQVGNELYETVYLKTLLLLVAAQWPVTLAQLEQWGVPGERLQEAMWELRDFCRERRTRSWHESLSQVGDHRYEIAHDAFFRFVSEAPELRDRLCATHEAIARRSLAAHAGRWPQVDPADESELYALCCLPAHLEAAELAGEHRQLLRDGDYATGCWLAGNTLDDKARHRMAFELYDRAVVVYRCLVDSEGDGEWDCKLAGVLTNKAKALQDLGQLREAETLYDEAILIYRRLVEEEGPRELACELADAVLNKANTLRLLARLSEATDAYDDAIATYLQLLEREGSQELARKLALALTNKALAMTQIGRLSEALSVYDEAIKIYRKLGERGGPRDLDRELAAALMNWAIAISEMGQFPKAVRVSDEAVTIYRRLVEQKGRRELVNELANALIIKAGALFLMDKLSETLPVYAEAVTIRRQLVDRDGRKELANALAQSLINKANTLQRLKRFPEAAEVYDEALGILRPLVEQEGRAELAGDLATALMHKGILLQQGGDATNAVRCIDEALECWERLVQTGMQQVVPSLVRGYRVRLIVLTQLRRWQSAARDVMRAIQIAKPIFDSPSPPEVFLREFAGFIQEIRDLDESQQQRLYRALGSDAKVVRKAVKGAV